MKNNVHDYVTVYELKLKFLLLTDVCKDIDQLTKIMQLVGKPSPEFLSKITSANVGTFCDFMGIIFECLYE